MTTLANLQHSSGSLVEIAEGKQISFTVDSYQVSLPTISKDSISLWVGTKEQVLQQLESLYTVMGLDPKSGILKFVVNVDKLLALQSPKQEKK
ncbi:MAG: hypothetical protein LBI53_04270 [Candidatus Peribacteria bacterium]|nr:hypothetical protein [Candidatus Peribacteria bacterium]